MAHAELYLNADSPPGLAGEPLPDPGVRADFQDRLEELEEAHMWLGEPELPPTVECWQVAGDALPTDVSIRFDAAGVSIPGRESAGDETVPLVKHDRDAHRRPGADRRLPEPDPRYGVLSSTRG